MIPYLILVAAAVSLFVMGSIAIIVARNALTPFQRWCVAGIIFMFGISGAWDMAVLALRLLGWMP